MMKFFALGWLAAGFEEVYFFRACLWANSHREAWDLARSLAPVECNHISVLCMSWLERGVK